MSTARTWSQATRFVEGLQAAAGERGRAARQRDACDVEQPPRLRAGAAELRAVLQDLNEFVISLDRLGSRMADGTADEGAIGEFVVDRDVARRLSHARRVLSVALDEQLSEAESTEIDALCEQGRFYGAEAATHTPDLERAPF